MERSIPIRDKRRSSWIPVHFVTPPEPQPDPALPPAITFRYRDQTVLCTLVYDDAGGAVGVVFGCPLCGQQCQFPRWHSSTEEIVHIATGGISFREPVSCLACRWHASILRGQATDLKTGNA